MPERSKLRTLCIWSRISPLLCALSLSSCQLFVSQPVSPPVEVRAPDPSPGTDLGRPPAPAEKPRPKSRALHFIIDSAKSTGRIATTLDPHGLGPRESACTCPLKGTITATLSSNAKGHQILTLHSVDLATSADGHLLYNWTPLIGSIRSRIPTGILTIRDHTIPGPLRIDPRGAFSHPGYHFKVGGTCQVQGRGLLLRKQVGNTEEDLTIKKTEPVLLTGSLVQRESAWIFHVPAAILKDRFNIDDEGSTMDLHFTGNITAVAR